MLAKSFKKIVGTKDLLHNYDSFIFDMDGVLWRGPEKVPYALEFLNHLVQENKNVFFLTNNSSVSRMNYVDKLKAFGFEHVKPEQIFCASVLAALYLKKNHPEVKKAFVIGMSGIIEDLKNEGIDVVDYGIFDEVRIADSAKYAEMEDLINEEIKAVVCGIDYLFNYHKLWYASLCIQKLNAIFIATNQDSNIKLNNFKIPGGGCMVQALRKATGIEPITTGKPNPLALDLILNVKNVEKSRCLMIGDNLETDIGFANNAGIDSLAVLTGVMGEAEFLEEVKKPGVDIPTFYSENLSL